MPPNTKQVGQSYSKLEKINFNRENRKPTFCSCTEFASQRCASL